MPKYTVEHLTVAQLSTELNRVQNKRKYRQALFSTISILITVAAICVLVATLFVFVLEVHGASMQPALSEGDLVVATNSSDFDRGDLIAFYHNNELLIKRVIALPGELVNIDATGNVSVNGEILEESYLNMVAMGESDLQFPYQVPGNQYFVMGDNRAVSIDSRDSAIGCVTEKQILGKLQLRIWPISHFELL